MAAYDARGSARIPSPMHDGLPFPAEEYRDRARRVRERMRERGVDVLFVTSPPNLLLPDRVRVDLVSAARAGRRGGARRATSGSCSSTTSATRRSCASARPLRRRGVLPLRGRARHRRGAVPAERGWLDGAIGARALVAGAGGAARRRAGRPAAGARRRVVSRRLDRRPRPAGQVAGRARVRAPGLGDRRRCIRRPRRASCGRAAPSCRSRPGSTR